MSLNANAEKLFAGFSKLTREQRFERLQAMGALTATDVCFLEQGGIKDFSLGEKLVENVIGYFQLPLGVATNFRVNDRDYVIPMAVEETSIIAALSKTAKWIRTSGKLTTSSSGKFIIGQVQIAKVKDFAALEETFNQNKFFLIEQVNEEVAANMVKRGGGVNDMKLRRLERADGDDMAVVHVYMDCCDAMGANIINQVLEFLKQPLEHLSSEKVNMCILSNLCDEKLTIASVEIHDIEPELGARIEEASIFAETDPYRAATHNKGIMNGIDPILIATGNDWRAVEAGAHAYAARTGQYKPLSFWRYQDGVLKGELRAPIVVGTVGGVTALHPTASMCLRMLDVESADDLSGLCAAVGLVQNLGAITALSTEGIIQGHMKLHINNLAMVAGAKESELPILKEKLQLCLQENKRVSVGHAKQLLADMRSGS